MTINLKSKICNLQSPDFPKLGYKERYIINQKRLRFDEAREYKEFGVLGKQRVVNFLKEAYRAFDSVGVWDE